MKAQSTLQSQWNLHSLFSFFILLLFVFIYSPAYNQDTLYFEAWSNTDGEADDFFNNVVSVTDASNNVYVASSTLNAYDHYDLLVTKYDQYGVEDWSETYNETIAGDAVAGGITLDDSGNVIITGTVYVGTADYDLYVIKYNSSGNEQWSETYDGTYSVYDGGKAIICDASDNIYVTGGSFESATHSDIVTIKYNSYGTEQWVSTFDNDDLHDGGATIGFYDANTLIVSGPSQVAADQWEYAVIRYSVSSGSELSSMITSSSGSTMDEFSDLAIDDQENVYLTGSVKNATTGFYDYKTFKLDADLDIVWEKTFVGTAEKDDMARAVGVDGSGNVYVSGFSTNSNGNRDIVTIKYNSSGTSLWEKKYDALSDDEAWDLVLDEEDNIFITGYSIQLGNKDFFTIMYDSNGNPKWKAKHNGIYNDDDVAKSIKLDGDGNLLVSGLSKEPTETTYLTVKYRRHETVIPPDEEPLSTAFVFVENRGQVVDTAQNLVPGLKFYNTQQSPTLYFFDDKISFALAHIDTSTTTQDTMHRVDMGLDKGGSRSTRVMPMDIREDCFNFYLGHIPEGRERVPLYERLIYPDVFEDIDLMMASNSAGAKYYFICKPGSDPDDIELNFNGQTSLSTSSGDLIIETSLEDIVLPEPTAYQIDGNGDPVSVGWTPTYSISSGQVTLTSGTYNSSQDLVFQINWELNCSNQIEENGNLIWSTFYHDTASSWGNDITSSDESVYVTGVAYDALFPTSAGIEVDNTFGGISDAFVVKFNLDYQRQWATFYGGSATDNPIFPPQDEANSIAVDANENVYFAGATNCNDFPTFATGSAYIDPTIGENVKAFLVKLNGQAGNRTWATYFGENNNVWANEIRSGAVGVNSNNHVFISGSLRMGGTGPGYGVEINNGGNTYYSHTQGSCYIAEFDEENDIVWSTMFGANDTRTLIHDITFDSNDNLILVGWFETGNLTGWDGNNNSGQAWYQSTLQGDHDGLIAKFNKTTRQLIWSTLFGGDDADEIYAAVVDENDNLYIFGNTKSDKNSFPVYLNPSDDPEIVYYNETIDGQDLFIARFTNEGARNWVTYYGGSGEENALHGLSYSNNGNVYITGGTNSTNFKIEQNQDFYYQPGINQPDPMEDPIEEDVTDAFIVSFNSNKQLIASSYYGGNNTLTSSNGDIGISLTSTGNKIYMVGNASRSTVPCFPTIEPEGTDVWFESSYNDGGFPDSRVFISEFEDMDFIVPIMEPLLHSYDEIVILPNPAVNNLTVYIHIPIDQISGRLEVTSILGQKLINLSVIATNKIELDASGLPPGAYVLTYYDKNKQLSKQLIITR